MSSCFSGNSKPFILELQENLEEIFPYNYYLLIRNEIVHVCSFHKHHPSTNGNLHPILQLVTLIVTLGVANGGRCSMCSVSLECREKSDLSEGNVCLEINLGHNKRIICFCSDVVTSQQCNYTLHHIYASYSTCYAYLYVYNYIMLYII